MVFITVVESVYSAVRNDSLYKADYVWSLDFIHLISLTRFGRVYRMIYLLQEYNYGVFLIITL